MFFNFLDSNYIVNPFILHWYGKAGFQAPRPHILTFTLKLSLYVKLKISMYTNFSILKSVLLLACYKLGLFATQK